MKKFLIVLFCLLILAVGAIYLFIPSQIIIRKEILVNANPQGTYRVLSSEKVWKTWMTGSFPAASIGDNNSLHFKNLEYRVYNRLMNGMEVVITDGKNTITSSLNVLPVSVDSCSLQWSSSIPVDKNPFNRLNKYVLAKKTAKNTREILYKMKTFLEQRKNIYHLNIFQRLVKDTVFMSTKATFPNYPSTSDIYSMIEKVNQHIQQQNGKQTNSPMLNVRVQSDSSYEVMVAVPVDRALPEKGNIFLKRMLFGGTLLEAEINGGIHKINQGFSDFRNFVMDYGKTPAAIPYEMLITDRSREPDTSKWVTKLFYPVY